MITPITTTHIDAAFAAAISTATALGASVARISPSPIATLDPGTTAETISVDRLTFTPHGGVFQVGFRVTAKITIGTYSVTRIHETIPSIRETAWPLNLAELAAAWLPDSIIAGESWVAAQGFWGTRTTDLSFTYLTALQSAGSPAALAVTRPVLASLYNWIMSVRSIAANGRRFFPSAPHSYEDFIVESHA